jgi:hypothetical protein
VQLTIGRLSAAFDLAARDRLVTANPCQYVKPPEIARTDPDTWSAAQVRAFLALRWCDIDLEGGTITATPTRPLANGQVIVKAPKSRRGIRTLPLDSELVAALRPLRDRQVTEAMEAGAAYRESGYVVTDELGATVHHTPCYASGRDFYRADCLGPAKDCRDNGHTPGVSAAGSSGAERRRFDQIRLNSAMGITSSNCVVPVDA